ncbi:MAG: hypothetical protein L3K15_04600 [Thermoplasmata archaeon]|nr:hypothetical protein [Thermoplasmata archaeon]
MTRTDRAELERLVQTLDRQHPDWPAADIERELAQRAAVSYGNWTDDTPSLESRLRQVQRWRTGFRAAGPLARAKTAYTFLWPMGEKQRQGVEPSFRARPALRRASHRIFVYNCSSETLRELRAKVGGVEVAYEPALIPQGFAELHWTRNPAILEGLLRAEDRTTLRHPLEVEFAVANGTRRASLKGDLSLEANDGWVAFRASDRSEKEIE